MSGNRSSYADVGARTRQAIERAGAAGAPAHAMRALAAVVCHLTTYSKTEDTVSRSQLAQSVGVDTRTISRGMAWLSKHGVLEWKPGSSIPGGARTVSRVAFPPVTGDRTDASTGDRTDASSDHRPVTDLTPTGDRSRTRPGHTLSRFREGTEKSSERSDDDPIRIEAIRQADDQRNSGLVIRNYNALVDSIEKRLRQQARDQATAEAEARARREAQRAATQRQRDQDAAAALTMEENAARAAGLASAIRSGGTT